MRLFSPCLVAVAALAACTTAPSPSVIMSVDPNPVLMLPSTAPCPPGAVCTTGVMHVPYTLHVTSNVDGSLAGVQSRVLRAGDGSEVAARSMSVSEILAAAGTDRLSAGMALSVPAGLSFERRFDDKDALLVEVTANVAVEGAAGARQTIRVPIG